MRIEIHCPRSVRASEQCRIRAVLFNDGFEPVEVSRNEFVGPNVQEAGATGAPRPESVEPTFGGPDQPLTLQPFSFYGREREFSGLSSGEVTVTARYGELSATETIQVKP